MNTKEIFIKEINDFMNLLARYIDDEESCDSTETLLTFMLYCVKIKIQDSDFERAEEIIKCVKINDIKEMRINNLARDLNRILNIIILQVINADDDAIDTLVYIYSHLTSIWTTYNIFHCK